METEQRDIIRKWINAIPARIRICFLTGLIVGLFTHLPMLTNKITNWDDINNMYGNGISGPFGRWFLDYTAHLAGMWSNPWLQGIFAIVMLSIASCLILSILQMKSMTSAILIPAILLSYPAMASIMTYMWLADAYALGILLACLGVYCIRKWKWGFLPGIICFICSLGTYQSFICFGAGLLVFAAVVDLIDGKKWRQLFFKCLKYLLYLGAGIVLYIITAKLLYPNMSDYNGIAEMGRLNFSELPVMILRTYKRILEFFLIKPFSFVTVTVRIINSVLCLAMVIMLFLLIRNRKLYREKPEMILLGILIVLEPLALASIYIMASDATMSLLMLYQYCIFYIMAAVFWEKWYYEDCGREKIKRYVKPLSWIVIVSLVLMVYQSYLVSNEAYFRMEIANERAKAYYNRIIDRVEIQEGYRYGDKIVLMGEFFVKGSPNTNPLASYRMNDERFYDFAGVALENGLLTTGARRNFIRLFIGADMPEVTQQEQDIIQESPEFAAMPDYPAEGSVQQIGDIWVVRLCYNWETYQKSVTGK